MLKTLPLKSQCRGEASINPFQAVLETVLGSSRILSVQQGQKKESVKDCRHTHPHHFCAFPPCGDSTCSGSGSLCSAQLVSWTISSFSLQLGELEGGSWDTEVSSCREELEELDSVYSPIHTLMEEQLIRIQEQSSSGHTAGVQMLARGHLDTHTWGHCRLSVSLRRFKFYHFLCSCIHQLPH